MALEVAKKPEQVAPKVAEAAAAAVPGAPTMTASKSRPMEKVVEADGMRALHPRNTETKNFVTIEKIITQHV